MKKTLTRLAEPSTWAGIASLLTVFGLAVPQAQAISVAGAALSGLAAMFLGEKGAS